MPYVHPWTQAASRARTRRTQVLVAPGPPTMLLPARVNRTAYKVRNIDPAALETVYLGEAAVTVLDGFPLNPGPAAGVFGDTDTDEDTAAVFAVVPGGLAVLVAIEETTATQP